MKNLSRKERLIENEVIFKDVNQTIQEFIEETEGPSNKKYAFYCECSRPNCHERVDLTTTQYEELHRNSKSFVLKPGHEFPEVEKVIEKDKDYQIVEKYFEPPKPEDIDLALKAINSSPAS